MSARLTIVPNSDYTFVFVGYTYIIMTLINNEPINFRFIVCILFMYT